MTQPPRDNPPRILVLGYGNPGRCDDGLGPAFAQAIEAFSIPSVTVQSDYMLNIEDAALVAEHDVVLFADAACTGPEPFEFQEIDAKSVIRFTSHSLSPAALLASSRELFQANAAGYVLAIRGYEFDAFGEWISQGAQSNLESAVRFIRPILESCRFDDTTITAAERMTARHRHHPRTDQREGAVQIRNG